ncbi:lipid storage droplets surface-binding protein 2-like [Aedes aegypti]|uniref:Uncharacterized protein n=1 Tax=Aedes aegypti TaxID=7159 RepID=A0A6I8TJW7_AEDAE|nr:lipid storage droplets surface-binding protein 2-like [Aedes aegypti]
MANSMLRFAIGSCLFCFGFTLFRVKDFNPLRNRASISAPLVHKFDGLLQLVKGIDRLEVSVPIIKEQPQEIHNQAKSKVLGMVKPYAEKVYELQQAFQQKAASLKELS